MSKDQNGNRLFNWLRRHKLDSIIIAILVVISGVVGSVNMTGYPGRFEDEGTYISQARAVQHDGKLAHYTYWYDHPPVGWIQIAAYNAVTFADERYEDVSISAGREFMIVMKTVSVVLLYAIARRLRVRKSLAFIAPLLFILSPLAIHYGRFVFLENVAMPWLLGAFLLALSPKKRLSAAIGSAVCMAIAVLSKETLLIFLPALLYAQYQNSDKRNRSYAFVSFGVVLAAISSFYLLYAVLKNELIPGEGHVSLIGSLMWQLSERAASGNIFTAGSDGNKLLESWLLIDMWLMLFSIVMLPLAFIKRHQRPFALALLTGLLIMLRPGYLPIPYILGLLPFMGLAITLGLNTLVELAANSGGTEAVQRLKRFGAIAVTSALLIAGTALAAPAWHKGIAKAFTEDQDKHNRQLIEWADKNIPKDSTIVVDSILWSDLERKGFSQDKLIWVYKIDSDPEVAKRVGGWQGVDYLILDDESRREEIRDEFPTVLEALDNAEKVKEFKGLGPGMTVLKVKN